MLPRSTRYLEALAAPHSVFLRLDVHSGSGALLESDLTYSSGQVSASLASRVARRLSVTVTEDLYPTSYEDLLSPFGNELRAYRGIVYGDGSTEVFQAFRGRIQDVQLDSDGLVEVLALDRAADVVGAQFEAPYVAPAARITQSYRNLVTDVLPDAVFDEDALEIIHETNPDLIFESDRAQAADDLAATAGAFWFPLADGTFTMIRVPWAHAEASPLYTLADGPGGLVMASSLSQSREEVYNSVTVYTERSDGSEPLFHTARDTDPSSPTYVLGNFGLRAAQVALQTPTSQAQVRTAAETALRRSKSVRETVGLEVVPDGSIELGDVFTAQVRGRTLVQVVAGLTLPLVAGASMSLDCRSLIGEVQYA